MRVKRQRVHCVMGMCSDSVDMTIKKLGEIGENIRKKRFFFIIPLEVIFGSLF